MLSQRFGDYSLSGAAPLRPPFPPPDQHCDTTPIFAAPHFILPACLPVCVSRCLSVFAARNFTNSASGRAVVQRDNPATKLQQHRNAAVAGTVTPIRSSSDEVLRWRGFLGRPPLLRCLVSCDGIHLHQQRHDTPLTGGSLPEVNCC